MQDWHAKKLQKFSVAFALEAAQIRERERDVKLMSRLDLQMVEVHDVGVLRRRMQVGIRKTKAIVVGQS